MEMHYQVRIQGRYKKLRKVP